MITAVASTALSIVREKESGTIEQVRMAPIGTFSFVVGKTIPYFLISFSSAVLIILASMVLFGLPMRGNWFALLASLSLFLVGALGTGLLISTIATSQQVAFQIALLISLLPTIMLSGFIFPISSMPVALQAITYVVPARYFLVALRGIVLKGAPLVHLLAPLERWRSRDGHARAGVSAAGAAASLRLCSACASRLEGISRAQAGAAPVRHRHRRADSSADDAGYAATTDVKDAGRGRGRRSLGRKPRAVGAVRCVAELHCDRHRDHRGGDRAVSRARPCSAGAVDPGGDGDAIATGRPVKVQAVADGTDSNSTTVALGTRRI
jgi:hypothetical protein